MIQKVSMRSEWWHYNLPLSEIIYVEQEADYHHIHTVRDGLVRKHGTMESLHNEYPGLLRAHRSYLVNPHKLRAHRFDAVSGRIHLLFENGLKVSIGKGRSYYDEFTAQWANMHNGDRI